MKTYEEIIEAMDRAIQNAYKNGKPELGDLLYSQRSRLTSHCKMFPDSHQEFLEQNANVDRWIHPNYYIWMEILRFSKT